MGVHVPQGGCDGFGDGGAFLRCFGRPSPGKQTEYLQEPGPPLQNGGFPIQKPLQKGLHLGQGRRIQKNPVPPSLLPPEKQTQIVLRFLSREGNPIMPVGSVRVADAVVVFVGPGEDHGTR